MEQATLSALERINNPILIILLCVLMVAVVTLWWQLTQLNKRLYDLAIEGIGAIKDTNTRLSQLTDQVERVEAKINMIDEKN